MSTVHRSFLYLMNPSKTKCKTDEYIYGEIILQNKGKENQNKNQKMGDI